VRIDLVTIFPGMLEAPLGDGIVNRAREAGLAEIRVHDLRAFTELTASESPAPGGGSVSAAVGALGAALGAMVANLSSHRRGWGQRVLEARPDVVMFYSSSGAREPQS
jgi:tRNA G37 N-methylase TrmD